jgi:hypothetical protein
VQVRGARIRPATATLAGSRPVPAVSLMHAIIEASTAIAARCTQRDPRITSTFSDQTATFLQNLPVDEKPLQGLIKTWAENSSHGLYPLLATVMLQLYTMIFGQVDTLAMQDGLHHALENLRGEAKHYRFVHTTRFFVAERAALKDQPLSTFIAIDCNKELQEAMKVGPGDLNLHYFWAKVLEQHRVKRFRGQIEGTELKSELLGGAVWFKPNNDRDRNREGFEDLTAGEGRVLPVMFSIGISDSGPVAYGVRLLRECQEATGYTSP